jgi:MFS family permease
MVSKLARMEDHLLTDHNRISYIELIIYGVLFLAVLLGIPETRKRSRQADGHASHFNSFREVLYTATLRPVRMANTEFIVSSFTLWSSFAFGTVLIMTQSVPLVFSGLYGWEPWQTGVVQVVLFIGEAIGLFACVVQDIFIYPWATKKKENPEARLFTSIPGSFLGLTLGLFLYAWTASASVPWIAPAIGLACVGFGIMCIVQAVTVYVTDSYPSHAASAISVVACGENIFAAFLPLSTRDMYDTLGFHWASTFLGCIGLLVSCAPVVLLLAGPRIRSKSQYAGY